jgi:hypothetical protein
VRLLLIVYATVILTGGVVRIAAAVHDHTCAVLNLFS